jgi:hypothetical protein
MNCTKCKIESPTNVISISKEWLCADCNVSKDSLKTEIAELYKSGKPGHYLYISELTNNLDKIQEFFKTGMALDNPFCTVTLALPNHLGMLMIPFDGIYIDKDCVVIDDLLKLKVKEHTFIKWVEPITQIVIPSVEEGPSSA